MKKTKIEWCDSTINPVVGCPRGCEYCYARKLNTRFKWIPDFSKPQFYPERLKEFESKKPKNIFVNSMSDWAFWKDTQREQVMRAIMCNPQHNYIFLTKSVYFDDSRYMPNVFSGYTVTTQADMNSYNGLQDFLSIEPILEYVDISVLSDLEHSYLKQIIIGAETGNRKGKVIPRKEWIESLCRQADYMGIKVFMKDSLIPIVGEKNMRRELIWRNK